ncbi:hypothetical protein PILCRDRAFT_16407 [Piloderma croceum F 1598]|uniref:Uncharacterized protein n=1 Tax=Piloderma croceum (strain F 1598) TaxID=765440 RepID=A0A0C3B4E5_PILCF|nr:hypothetical protein PILCRDRAFT_16407 [Piloderma croceum F 1598]
MSNHQQSCTKLKKRLSSALDKAKEVWKERKKPRLHANPLPSPGLIYPILQAPPVGHGKVSTHPNLSDEDVTHTNETILTQPAAEVTDVTADDSHMSMMDHRRLAGKCKIQLPQCFRDEIPQPPTPLPLVNIIQPIGSPEVNLALMDTEQALAASASSSSAPSQIIGRLRRAFRTQPNIFGLFCSYDGKAPIYDPEEQVLFHDLSNVPECTEPTEGQTLYPFPNCTSFRLAEWHWNGVQKSQASFHELITITGDPEFRSEDVHDVNWDHIHSKLGTDESDSEWLDEDASWT